MWKLNKTSKAESRQHPYWRVGVLPWISEGVWAIFRKLCGFNGQVNTSFSFGFSRIGDWLIQSMGWDPKPDPLQKLLCVSYNNSYNLSAASSNPSPRAQDKPVQKWEIQHCVIYRAVNAISINTHVGWCLVHSCSGQLSEYFDTLSMTNNFLMLKSIIFITRKRKCYAKSQVHLSRIILKNNNKFQTR